MDRLKLDQAVQALQDHKDAWATLPIPRKMDLLLQTRKRLGERGEAWVEASVRGKQIDPRSPWVGEEWNSGPWALAAAINGYLETLRALCEGRPPKLKKVFTRPNGQVVARVFPNNIFDTLLLNGITADVWMQPGVTEANLVDHMATFYKHRAPAGHVALVLGATLIVHPATMKELGPALDEAISDLRYGSVSVNVWCGVTYALAQAPWGAYPGHTYDSIQSGIGIVHNSFLFDKPEKTVSRGSFYPFPRSWLHGDLSLLPRPPWFVTNKTAHTTTRRIAKFAADPGYRHFPGIFVSALRG